MISSVPFAGAPSINLFALGAPTLIQTGALDPESEDAQDIIVVDRAITGPREMVVSLLQLQC